MSSLYIDNPHMYTTARKLSRYLKAYFPFGNLFHPKRHSVCDLVPYILQSSLGSFFFINLKVVNLFLSILLKSSVPFVLVLICLHIER
jgi:hypothetical protein